MAKMGFTMEDLKGMSGRDAYGKTLAQLGKEDERIVVLTADALDSTRGSTFAEKFPDRTFNFGIAEANMVSAAAGFAIAGKIPIVTGYGFLLSMRAAEQVRTDICYPGLNVKLVTTATGLAMGTGGTTHHCTEDLAIMRSFANMTIVCPASPIETVHAVRACILEHRGPLYLRLVRGADFGGTEEIYEKEDIEFKIGEAVVLKDGEEITLIAAGQPVGLALQSADVLEKRGISVRVINMHTVKPINKEAINQAAKETEGIVTIEEHNVLGGLGEAVCAVVCENKHPVPVKRIGIRDEFCCIGPTPELWQHHGLNEESIIRAAQEILE